MGEETEGMLKMTMTELNLSARAYNRNHNVGRTIADLEGQESIGAHHIAEAIQYRTPRVVLEIGARRHGTLAGDVLAVLEESDFSQTAAAVPFEHVTRTRSMLKLWCGIFTATFVSLGVVIPALDREN